MSRIESLEDYEKKKKIDKITHGKNEIIAIVIIIILSIIIGIGTYIISDSILNKNKKDKKESYIGEQVDLSDENIQILYQYVTYGAEGGRNKKFVENENIDLSSFTNEEKLYYALQFAQAEDFKFTGEFNNNKSKIYTLPISKINYYMKLFFGPSVSYTPIDKATYPFTFQINRKNVGTMVYNSSRDGYDTVFEQLKTPTGTFDSVQGQLISAVRKADGSIILQERIVYTELRTDNGGYAVDVYKDFSKTTLLESKTNLTDNDLNQLSIDISSYPSTAIVEYTFGVDNGTCYFESSRIIS